MKANILIEHHVGKLFYIPKSEHYRFVQNPTYRAMYEWNLLSVRIRNSLSKNVY